MIISNKLNMNKTKIVLGIILVLALVYVGATYPKSNPVINQIVGSSVGPESTNDYQCYNGVCTYYKKMAFTTATTTPCDFVSPGATSTLISTGFSVTTATATAIVIDVATSSIPNATTTTYITWNLASGKTVTIEYAPTTTEAMVLAPSTHVVWGARGFVPAGTSYLLGKCTAKFSSPFTTQ